MDDEFGADDALLAAMAATDTAQASRPRVQQPTPRKVRQPTPQRLDRAPPSNPTNATAGGSKVVQPTPQTLPAKQSGSAILVSPRQRGNPVLSSIRSMPWEYSDIPADFVLGLTTSALFLSLKYHRLHPEYIYTRIRNLQGKYNLRVLLTMVDIPNHEDSLRELSKTSLVNNVTMILCWSAAETARYIELYKSYENASFAAIRGQQPSTYGDKLIDFVTVPRSLNKSDAVALVANFGSLRNAINADAEQLGMISGFGGVKVKRWSAAVEEPFRTKKAAKRGLQREETTTGGGTSAQDEDRSSRLANAVPLSRVPLREVSSMGKAPQGTPGTATPSAPSRPADAGNQFQFLDDSDDEEALQAATSVERSQTSQQHQQSALGASSASENPIQRPRRDEEDLSSSIAAELAKLREKGG